jgi:hypothetical protein
MCSRRPAVVEGRKPVSRRTVLATAGSAAVASTAGCSSRESDGEGDTVEVIVANSTPEPARIAVRLEDEDGSATFSRVDAVDAGHTDSTAGVETPPRRIVAFTPDGVSDAWEYAPDLDVDCRGTDVGIQLTPDGFEPYYTC